MCERLSVQEMCDCRAIDSALMQGGRQQDTGGADRAKPLQILQVAGAAGRMETQIRPLLRQPLQPCQIGSACATDP